MSDRISEDSRINPAELFDPMSPEFIANPHGAYRVAREKAPVCPLSEHGPWVITGREEMAQVLRDPLKFTSRNNTHGAYELTDQCKELLSGSLFYRVTLFNSDPETHGRFRSLVNEEFTPRALRRREPAIRELAKKLVRDFQDAGSIDLLSGFAYPLPMTVICDIIGVPAEDHATVKAWNDDWLLLQVMPLPPEEQLRCAKSVLAYEEYYRGLLADRAGHPADDLLSVLVEAAARQDAACTLDDAVLALQVILAAGHETTTNLIANTLHQLLRDRSLWEKAVADRELIPAAVEEGLRFDTSVQGAPRLAAEDTTVGGVTIPAGAKVHTMFAAVGRDPGLTEDPETFRLDRSGPPRHFAFGHGIHFCLGASLGRLESRIALETLAEALPGIELAPGFEPRYVPGGLVFHGLSALPVTWPTD